MSCNACVAMSALLLYAVVALVSCVLDDPSVVVFVFSVVLLLVLCSVLVDVGVGHWVVGVWLSLFFPCCEVSLLL